MRQRRHLGGPAALRGAPLRASTSMLAVLSLLAGLLGMAPDSALAGTTAPPPSTSEDATPDATEPEPDSTEADPAAPGEPDEPPTVGDAESDPQEPEQPEPVPNDANPSVVAEPEKRATRQRTEADPTTQETEKPNPARSLDIGTLAASPGPTQVNKSNTFFAYVEADENLDVAFSKYARTTASPVDGTVTVRGPGGFSRSCPLLVSDPGGSGCEFTDLSAATDGIWQISFEVPDSSPADPDQTDRYRWTIDVQAGTTPIPGRVYTHQYTMTQRSVETTDVELWYMSKQGFQYSAVYNDYNGIDSVFTADATGIAVGDSCVSAYRSRERTSTTLSDPAAGACGEPYKIFFEQPDPALPGTATLWNGETTWTNPAVVLPTLSNFTFAPDSPSTRTGEFAFDVSGFVGQLEVLVDANGDGDYTDAVDVTVPGVVTDDGSQAVTWDGLDGRGEPVPATQDINARLSITQAAEIHFTNSDVEMRGGGLEVIALNGPDAGNDTLYWNDTLLSSAGKCSTTDPDGRAGVASAGGAHAWGPGTCSANGSGDDPWGNGRDVDDWTYQTIDESADIAIPGEEPTPWPCATNAPGVLFQHGAADNAATTASYIEMVTGGDYTTPTSIADNQINAVGFNVRDGYVYGWENDLAVGTGQLVRVGSEGLVSRLGRPAGVENGVSGIGDVDENGHYWTIIGDAWFQIDLGTETLLDTGPVSGGGVNTYAFGNDWVYVPGGGDYLYRVMSNGTDRTSRLLRFNRSTHLFEYVGPLGNLADNRFGATYADADGFMYASSNQTGRIFRIDVHAVTATRFAEGPSAANNDGTRCASSPILLDLGDAPEDLDTSLSANGPRHGLQGYDSASGTAPLMLGASVDPETDGAPSTGADGDDTAIVGLDDEDAVSGPIQFTAGRPTTVPVSVTNDTNRQATLAAWADLNGDKTFDSSERVTVPVPANTGTTTRDVAFGAPLPACQTVRFRILPGDVADPSPTGSASAGEVEDHPVTVAPDCTADDVPRTISGVAQSWTPSSRVQSSTLPASNAVNGPDNVGTQLYSGSSPASSLTLDLATVVPEGYPVTLHIGRVPGYSGPVRVTSSADGTTFANPVDFSPTAAVPSYQELEYVVRGDGARFIRIVPIVVGGTHSAVRVDAVTYSFEYCECEDAANFIQDGTFESFAECSWQTGTFGAWRVLDDTIHIWGERCPRGWTSPEGMNSIDLDGLDRGGIEQAVTGLRPGNRYNLSFYMAFNPAAGAQSSSMRVTVGDFDQTYTSASNATLGGFNLVHVEFTADRSTEVLRFRSLTGTNDSALLNGGGTRGYGVVLDDIRITPKNCDEVRVPQDLGDAPSGYGTLLTNQGATHAVPGYDETSGRAPVMLGGSIDTEPDGQPNAAADGDGADDDGVVLNRGLGYADPVVRTGVDPSTQQPVENTLDVVPSEDGYVSAWVDWNQDGDFADTAERVVHAHPVRAGANQVSFAREANPDDIATYMRVRYSTDPDAVADPTGAAPDGEVEDYRVLVERLVAPDACVPTEANHYAFTFSTPKTTGTTGGVGDSARYADVAVVGGVAVDMYVEVIAGDLRQTTMPPNGFGVGAGDIIAPDDAQWNISRDATLRYSFFEAGTTTPVTVSGAFTINDMDGAPLPTEIGTFSAADLTSYAVTRGSAVTATESGGLVSFRGHGNRTGDLLSRFQIVLDGVRTFDARWQGADGSGFGLDGDGDLGVRPPACEDFGDAAGSYGTTLAQNGPRHTITADLSIGGEVEFDPDGQPDAAADGDDTNRVDDEDAFSGPAVLQPGVGTRLTIPVRNTTGSTATLYGWVDANGNGRFEATEFASVPVLPAASDVDLVFSGLPALRDGTQPMVRLRLTTDDLTDAAGTANVDERALGAAGDGEVEDHLAQVATPVPISCVDPFVEDFGTGTGYGEALPPGQTTYTHTTSGPVQDGTYALPSTLPGTFGTWWHVGLDHTVADDNGRMMLVNAAYDAGTFVQRTFTGLVPGAKYDFSAWITNANNAGSPIVPNVTFRVVDPESGTVLQQVSTGNIPNAGSLRWDRYAMQFTASQSRVRLELVNNAPGGNGNDLAIDDVGFMPVCEFGDAPDTYGTTIASGGAGHIAAGPTLGTARDTEPDGQASAGATGDDRSGADDEDGVTGPVEVTVGDRSTVTVSATNDTDQDVTLAGWIDLDGDRLFEDVELVTVTVPAGSGTADYELVFPAGTTTTDTYARFRLYGEVVEDPRPTGTAGGGEVEDHPVTVLEPALAFTKTSDADLSSRPGDVVTYEVTATNNGTGDFTETNPAVVVDALAGAADDADYNGDAVASVAGTAVEAPTYAEQRLTWTGALASGEKVTIIYSVTLKGGGDGEVRNVVFQPPCSPGDDDCDLPAPDCVNGQDPETGLPCATEEFDLPKLSVLKTASRTALPARGEQVTYTVTVRNEGPGDYTVDEPATFTDDLARVLDDATIETATITATVGTATYGDQALSWTGVLTSGQSAQVRYTVTYTGEGDQVLVNNACVPADQAQDPQDACGTVRIPGAGLDQDKVSDPASGESVEAGDEITYTLRFTNTGQTTAQVDTSDDLSGILDDAEIVGTPTPDPDLSVTFDAQIRRLTVTGSVPVGESREVTYRVRVLPYFRQGDHLLRNALACQEADTEDCEPERTEHPVQALLVEKTSDRSPATEIGDPVTYTVRATNIGGADYTVDKPARLADDLTGLLDDGAYQRDAEADRPGTLAYDEPVLRWAGALPVAASVELTYTVEMTGAGDKIVRNVAWGGGGTPPTCDPQVEGHDPTTGQPCDRVEFGLPYIVDSKSVDPGDGTVVKAGDELTYELTFRNEGTAVGAVAREDVVAGVLDDAVVTSGPTSSDPSALSVTGPENGRIDIRGTLEPGRQVTVSYTVEVKPDALRELQGDDSLGNFLVDRGQDPPESCEPADEDCTLNPVPRIVDTKSVEPGSGSVVQAGDELAYTLTFRNEGTGAGQVTRDDLVGGVLDDAVLIGGPSSSAGGALAASGPENGRIRLRGTLQPGQEVTVTYRVRVKPDAQREREGDDVLGNFLVDAGEQPPEECLPSSLDCTVNRVPRIVDMKSVEPSDRTVVQAGDELTYALTFTNEGTAPGDVRREDVVAGVLDDAVIVDGPTADSSALAVSAIANGRFAVTGTLQPDQTVTVTYRVRVKPDTDRATEGDDRLGNFVVDPGQDPPEQCEPGDVDCTTNPIPRVVDSKSVAPGDGTVVKAGDELTYRLTFRNEGTAAGDVAAEDVVTGVLDDARMIDAPTANDPALQVSAVEDGRFSVTGTLEPDQVVEVTYRVRVKPDAERALEGDDLLGNFLVEPGEAPSEECDEADPDCTVNRIPRIVDRKTVTPGDGTVVVAGDPLTYTLSFRNEGTAAGEVTRDDVVSGVLDDAVLTSGPTSSDPAALTVTGPENGRIVIRGTLAAGQEVTVTYRVRVKPDAQREQQGDDSLGNFLVDAGGDPPPTCEAADADCTVNPIPRIVDRKSVDPPDGTVVVAGDELTYTLTFSNEGTGVGRVDREDVVAGVLDDAVLLEAPSPDDAALDVSPVENGRFRVTGDLQPDQTVSVVYKVRVKPDAQRAAEGDDSLGNFLVEPGQQPPTHCADGDPACTTSPVPRIVTEKSVDPVDGTTVVAGDQLTYTLTLTNEGTGAGDVATEDVVSGVLDDAVVVDQPTADGQALDVSTIDEGRFTVAGSLEPDQTVTVSYTVRVKPDAQREVEGDDVLGNFLLAPGEDPPEQCPVDDLTCTTNPVAQVEDAKSVRPESGSTVVSGQQLTYTLTFTNVGRGVGSVDKVDDLSGVLDDAAVVSGPTTSSAALEVSEIEDGRFSITGGLPAGETVTVTYTVGVNAFEELGDQLLGNYLLDPDQETPDKCDPAAEDATCNPVGDIVAEKSVDPADGTEVQPGDKLTYRLTFRNRGQGSGEVKYVDKMAGILDDAMVIDEPTASENGWQVMRTDGRVRISGTLDAGESATVSYTVRTLPFEEQGDHNLVNFLDPVGGGGAQVCGEGNGLCTENPIIAPRDASAGGPGDGDLGDTGAGYTPWLVGLGGALVLLGLVVVVATYRRRKEM